MIDYPIPVNPSILLLSDNSLLNLSKLQITVWLAGLTSAKKLLAQHWLSPHSLDMCKWLIQLRDIIMFELSMARVNLAQMSTLKIWTIVAEKISKYIAQNNDQDSEWMLNAVFLFYFAFLNPGICVLWFLWPWFYVYFLSIRYPF